jgi:integrase
MSTETTKQRQRRARGEGSVQWKNGRPYAVYYDLLTGKRRWEGCDSEEEAEAFLLRIAADKAEAALKAKAAQAAEEARAPVRRPRTATHGWTFGELIMDWEDRHRSSVAESTWRDYGPNLADLRAALGAVRVRALEAEHFERLKTAKLKGIDVTGVRKEGVPPLKPATVVKRLDMAKRLLDDAIKRGIIEGPNPVAEVKRPRIDRDEPRAATEAEMRALIAAAENVELRALVRCYCELALRFGEGIGLPIDGFDPDARTLRIRQQVVEQREPKPLTMVLKPYTKSPWGIRTLRCSEALAAELRQVIELRAQRDNEHRLIFTDARGGIIRESNWLRDKWRPLLRTAKLSEAPFTPHACRHGRASLIAHNHSELFAPKLQRFLGHHSVAFTLQRYASHFAAGILEPEEYLTDISVADLGDPDAGT